VIKVVCEKGPTLEKTYFVATDEKGDKAVVRASKVLDPKLHTVANEDNNATTPKLEVQPENFIEKFEKMCPDLESFKKLAYSMAIENEGVGVKAAKESDAPVMSTEDPEKVKVEKEPTVAAEAQYVADEVKTESSPAVRKFFGKLPGKASGSPEIALDLQSKLQAVEEQLKAVTAEKEDVEKKLDGVQKENEGMKKAGGAEKVLKLLADLGVAEDAKDKDAYTKKLSSLPEQAMGVLESILKDVLAADGGGEVKPKAPFGGAPKPPMGGIGGAPKKPEGLESPLDSRANVIHASFDDAGWGAGVADTAALWLKADRAKELAQR
jgi:hypothetical protein